MITLSVIGEGTIRVEQFDSLAEVKKELREVYNPESCIRCDMHPTPVMITQNRVYRFEEYQYPSNNGVCEVDYIVISIDDNAVEEMS